MPILWTHVREVKYGESSQLFYPLPVLTILVKRLVPTSSEIIERNWSQHSPHNIRVDIDIATATVYIYYNPMSLLLQRVLQCYRVDTKRSLLC